MEVTEAPQPEPAPGEVLLTVEAVGICGSELEGYLGNNSLRVPPLVMGHEFSGRVAKVGPSVPADWLGQRVVVNPLLSCGRCGLCLRGLPQLCRSRQIVGVH